MRNILMGILQECRKGHDACLAINMVRNVRQQNYCSQQKLANLILRNVLDDWIGNGNLVVGRLAFADSHDGYVGVELDWELFKVFLCQWARGADLLLITWFVLADEKPRTTTNAGRSMRTHKLEMRFQLFGVNKTSPSSAMTEQKSCVLLANHLNGKFNRSLDTFTVRVDSTATCRPRRLSRSSLSCIFEKDDIDPQSNEVTLPSNLRFAILDDNSLVRKNVERISKVHLNADAKSFSRGRSFEECLKFAEELVSSEVDIAIFDENLEFDDIHLSGSDIARLARQRGFTGCMVRHSAQTVVEPAGSLFDGYVEKTTSRQDFASGIAQAWMRHKERLINASTLAGIDEMKMMSTNPDEALMLLQPFLFENAIQT